MNGWEGTAKFRFVLLGADGQLRSLRELQLPGCPEAAYHGTGIATFELSRPGHFQYVVWGGRTLIEHAVDVSGIPGLKVTVSHLRLEIENLPVAGQLPAWDLGVRELQ